MAKAPKDIIAASDLIKAAWKKYAVATTFGGMTEAQYEAKIKPSYDIRAQISDLEKQLSQLITDRELADAKTKDANSMVVKGIVGDIAYGDDSDIYGACGYVRKSDKKSGLTRKNTKVTPKVANGSK
jgi:hypothetical protein